MEGLKILIRNLAFILLLATFLEMLLPNKSMRGFVQLVMGLFVIAAILNPLADFLSIDLSNEIPAWSMASSSDMPVLAAEGVSDTGKSAVREQYKRILVNQITVLVSTIEGVKSTEVKIELDKEAGGFSDYPKILRVDIVFSQKSESIKPVSPVIIGEGSKASENIVHTDKALYIQKQVSSLMQIPEEIVSVKEKV